MFDLREFRTARGLTQAQMSQAMGIPLRTYEDLEAGRSALRPVHINAARYAAWQLRNPKSLKDLPLEFFVARFRSATGGWSVPWSVWAIDFPQAVDRFYNLGSVSVSSGLEIRHMPRDASEHQFSHGKQYADIVLEHRLAHWPDEA